MTPAATAHDTDSIASFRFAPDQWLWCLHCGRFFQGRDARADTLGGVQACAFPECDGAGYECDIFDWDTWPRGQPAVAARWPCASELTRGLVAPPWNDDESDDDFLEWDDDLNGAALNPDAVRRDAILGIVSDADVDEVSPFANLNGARLEQLVLENFVAPEARCNTGPTVRELLDFVRRWPEVTVHGYAVHPARRDYRVTLEGVACELRPLPYARAEALREAFHDAFGHADAYFNEADWLYAWWD